MTFDEVLEQVRELLQSKGRVAYRALKRRFELDEEYLEDLKAELIDAEHVAHDEDGKVLVWTGSTTGISAQSPILSSSQPLTLRTADSESRPPNAPSSQTLDAQREAERRQLTVLFCDLVGSTALSAQLDPEELREVVQAYQATCTGVTQRYEGHIAQHLGDGLLVYCGYPVAHEDDAQRAVRTGLEIVAGLQSLNARLPPAIRARLSHPLQVRIGIHTGLVVIGEIRSAAKREILALGETPNLAARLQGLAEPDTVVLSAVTQRLVQGLFACQELGPQMLKGLSTPLVVYRVVEESAAQSRFEAAARIGLTPLVGREQEVDLLLKRWERATAGEGQVVLLSGEPGIGKSRLVQVLKERVAAEAATRIEFRCSPYHPNSAFYPIIEHLQRLLQFAQDDTPQTKLTKLQQALAAYRFPQADTVSLLATLLSLPQPEGAPPLTLSPQKQKQRTQEALVEWMVEEAAKAAVYCAWEDLHWADPSTLEFLTLVLDQIPAARLLAVLTFRPDFTPPWRPRSHLTHLALHRLGRPQVEAMVGKVTGGKALPAEVVHQIVAKTDGVPLFVEELTKMVVESGLLREGDGRYELTGPLPPLAIPTTLQDSLMARLDQLGPAREVAQLGATLGREFPYALLQAVSPMGATNLQHALTKLIDAELLYQRGLPPQATYLFKHALIQDTAYHSLLKSRRQQYHQYIAQVLEERFPDTKETQPELLAHHYTEAGLSAQAIPYWQQAGQRAIQRSANVEAISHLTKGLELLKALPDTPERAQQELALQTILGPAFMTVKGQAAPEVERTYARARELCRQIGEAPQLFPVLWGLWYFYLVRAELQTARELGEQLLSMAQSAQDSALLLAAHRALGQNLTFLGESLPARAHLEHALALYDPQQHRALALQYGQDLKVVCQSWAALALWLLGYPDQALQKGHEAIALAEELAHPYSLIYALNWATMLHLSRRERQAAQERAADVLAISREHGIAMFVASGTLWQGRGLAMQASLSGGQREEGLAQMRQGLAAWLATGAGVFQPYFLALLAEAYGVGRQVAEGLHVLAEAVRVVDKTAEHYWEAELHRLKGELSLKSRQAKVGQDHSEVRSLEAEAEACFQKAIEIARKQSAKSLELRAVMSLARLWQQQDKHHEAHNMLSAIYNWFTEGFDTKDLQDAKSLLDELS